MTCSRCGRCCSGELIVEADALDVIREPKIAYFGILMNKGLKKGETLPPEEWTWTLACGTPCPLLLPAQSGRPASCAIYETRPAACVVFFPGEPRCAHPVFVTDEQASLAVRQRISLIVAAAEGEKARRKKP